MKKCPNPNCKSRSHATDAVFCHLCGAKLIENLSKETQTTQEKTTNYSGGTDGISEGKILKTLLIIAAVGGLLFLCVHFWAQVKIILFIIEIAGARASTF